MRPAAAHPGQLSRDPARVLDVELSAAIEPVEPTAGDRACSLVRLHGRPLGLVELDLAAGPLSTGEHASAIWQSLGAAIGAHLVTDGLVVPDQLAPDGLPVSAEIPPCVEPLRHALSDPPLASVVVATRDGAATLPACLDSLVALYYPRYEIVVVDSAPSTNATDDVIEARYASKGVRYVREDHPGVATAQDRGLREARGSVVAFTRDDVIADPFWLARLVEAFGSARDAAFVTGLTLPLELETPAQPLESYGGPNKAFERQVVDLAPKRPTSPRLPDALGLLGSGANMALDTSAPGSTLVYEPSALVWRRYDPGFTAQLTPVADGRPTPVLELARRLSEGLADALGGWQPRRAGRSRRRRR